MPAFSDDPGALGGGEQYEEGCDGDPTPEDPDGDVTTLHVSLLSALCLPFSKFSDEDFPMKPCARVLRAVGLAPSRKFAFATVYTPMS